MDYKKYQELAQRTSNTKSHADAVLNGCMGLVGEAGEVVDVIKKYLFQGFEHAKAIERIKSEIGDVLWYIAQLCTGLNVSLDELMISDDAVCIMCGAEYQNLTMSNAAMVLSLTASQPYLHFQGKLSLSMDDFNMKLCSIPRIIAVCKYIVVNFCGSSLEECMTSNIEKLSARYPEGFDADRSNNRDASDQ